MEYQGMRDGKGVHTIRDPCYHKEKGAERMWEGEQMATNTSMVREITNFEMYTTWAHILSDSNVFCTPKGRGKTAGSNAPRAFIVTPPSGRGLVIPVFFFGGHLPQASARSKQYLPVIFVRLALFRQNFHGSTPPGNLRGTMWHQSD